LDLKREQERKNYRLHSIHIVLRKDESHKYALQNISAPSRLAPLLFGSGF
jgi:hypothetical protein